MQVPWDQNNCVVQTVRAAYDYYAAKRDNDELHPWYDTVAVQSTDPNVSWYAQLRLLFRWGEKNMAFIRWYEQMAEPDMLTEFGCVRLKWETVTAGRREEPHYQVVEMDTMLRRVFVVKDYDPLPDVPSYHVSAFKWDRMVPDKRSIADQDNDLGLDGSESNTEGEEMDE